MMTMRNQDIARQPLGQPSGGQFAELPRVTSDVALQLAP